MEKGREVGKVLDSSRIVANCKKDEIAELIDRSADEFIKNFRPADPESGKGCFGLY
ncbi:MAG: hypothetical protein HFI83_04895 [Eubacterium sp.]|nr:hypothetical protein [Eubacterium sp.]